MIGLVTPDVPSAFFIETLERLRTRMGSAWTGCRTSRCRPTMMAWFELVFPALVLNYLGQGPLVLTSPALSNPLFSMVPPGA